MFLHYITLNNLEHSGSQRIKNCCKRLAIKVVSDLSKQQLKWALLTSTNSITVTFSDALCLKAQKDGPKNVDEEKRSEKAESDGFS